MGRCGYSEAIHELKDLKAKAIENYYGSDVDGRKNMLFKVESEALTEAIKIVSKYRTIHSEKD